MARLKFSIGGYLPAVYEIATSGPAATHFWRSKDTMWPHSLVWSNPNRPGHGCGCPGCDRCKDDLDRPRGPGPALADSSPQSPPPPCDDEGGSSSGSLYCERCNVRLSNYQVILRDGSIAGLCRFCYDDRLCRQAMREVFGVI